MGLSKARTCLAAVVALGTACAGSKPNATPVEPGGSRAATVVAAPARAPAELFELISPQIIRDTWRYRNDPRAGKKVGVDNLIAGYLRQGVRYYVAAMDLPTDVKRRLLARINSHEFIDQLIPFVIWARDLYSPPEKDAENAFDRYLRTQFAPRDGVPGIEHTMFQWVPPKPGKKPAGQAPLGSLITRYALTLYDAIYLKQAGPAPRATIEDPVDQMPSKSPETVATVTGIMREILELLSRNFGHEHGAAEIIAHLLEDPLRMEALAYSIIDFLHQAVSRNYKMFSDRTSRSEEARKWMRAEVNRPGGGRLWDFLEYSLRQKRYGVHWVVDGLQGRLVEALASGDRSDPFIRRILQEYENAERVKPATQPTRPMSEQRIEFLKSFGRRGFRRAGYLDYFKKLYARHEKGIARSGVSTTPTISIRNVPIAMTGAPATGEGSTGLPNFHYVDRATDRAYYFFGNDAVLLDGLTAGNGMKTIAERIEGRDSLDCMGQFTAGSRFTIDAFANISIGEKKRDFGEVLCLRELRRRSNNELRLRDLRRKLLEKKEQIGPGASRGLLWGYHMRKAYALIREISELEHEGMPDYLLYYFPWPDHFAHFKGPFADEIISPSGELNRLDYWLRRVEDEYVRAGVIDRTLFAMAGDHGMGSVFHALNPEVEVFGKLRESGVDFRVRKISSDEGEGPKLNHPLRPATNKGYDVIVASTAGGNYMLDFFKDHGAGWSVQPVYEELTRLRTLAGREIDVIETMRSMLSESLEYLVVRERPTSVERAALRLVATRDGRRVDSFIEREGGRIRLDDPAGLLGVARLNPYVREPAAPLLEGYRAALKKCGSEARAGNPSTWCTEDDWRWLTSFTESPDSVVQLSRIYDSDFPGTVNLFPKVGLGYNTKVPGRHAGETFHEKDAFVGFWGAPVSPPERIQTAVNGSVPVVVYEFLTGEKATPAQNGVPQGGWGYPTIPEVKH